MYWIIVVAFMAGCVLTFGATGVTIMLTPKPDCLNCHLKGLARLMVLAGAWFGLARAASGGWTPTWDVTLYVLGIGLLSALYLRERWHAAKVREQTSSSSQGEAAT